MALSYMLSFLFGLGAAHAETRLDKRQEIQQQRIQQGIQNGSLTEAEAAKLQAEQGRIAASEEAAKADGVVTPKEKLRLEKMQDRQNREIFRKKHNKRKK